MWNVLSSIEYCNKLGSTFFSNRHQSFSINNKKFNSQYVDIGLPQGSILSLIPFLVFINDLVLNCDKPNKIIPSADDTNFATKSNDDV